MDLGLQNKIIIVTGGSKGIGSGIVKVLAEEGALPIIIGRDQNSILQAVAEYKKNGFEVGYSFAELTDPKQCEQSIQRIIENYGVIHGLVNNAGITMDNLSLRMKDEEWNKVIDINLSSTFYLCKHAIKKM